jgi:hypothetical protein
MKEYIHMRGVALFLSIPSTATPCLLSFNRTATAETEFNQEAKPNGVTPFKGSWGAFIVNRDIDG